MGDVEVVADFLPSPAELAFKEDGVNGAVGVAGTVVAVTDAEADEAKEVPKELVAVTVKV
jgi:hypothetical protein